MQWKHARVKKGHAVARALFALGRQVAAGHMESGDGALSRALTGR